MNPVMTIVMNNHQEIKIELFYEHAPNSISGLMEAIEHHAFDKMPIERVVPGFVLQPWCDETTKGEFYQYVCDGEFHDERHKFDAYCVGLAGDGDKISVPSCFFITLSDHVAHLNQKFAKIGKVISGFEEIQRIEHSQLIDVPCEEENVVIKRPKDDEIIETVKIEYYDCQPQPVKKYLA